MLYYQNFHQILQRCLTTKKLKFWKKRSTNAFVHCEESLIKVHYTYITN